MKVTINGKEQEVSGIKSVRDLLDHLGLDCSKVAVEVNSCVIKRDEYDQAAISHGDVVEIVRFVGGG